MPELIDIMTHLVGEGPYFTVDTSGVDFVDCVFPGAVNRFVYNANGWYRFRAGDNFRLLSFGLTFPENFAWYGEGNFQFKITPVGVISGNSYIMPNWFGTGAQFNVMTNYEMVQDCFFNCAEAARIGDPLINLNSENFQLQVTGQSGIKVSMFGVPNSLNGKVFYPRMFIKILHTLSFTA